LLRLFWRRAAAVHRLEMLRVFDAAVNAGFQRRLSTRTLHGLRVAGAELADVVFAPFKRDPPTACWTAPAMVSAASSV
jgi:hypothetical protein